MPTCCNFTRAFQKRRRHFETYTDKDTQQVCACSEAQRNKLKTLCDNRLRLRKPEYSLASKVRCQDVRLLPYAEGVTLLLDDRAWMDTPFLLQDELLYLVLLIFHYEIFFTAIGGYTTLHRLRDPEQAQFVDELFMDKLPDEDQFSLHEARQFNGFLDQHDSTSIDKVLDKGISADGNTKANVAVGTHEEPVL